MRVWRCSWRCEPPGGAPLLRCPYQGPCSALQLPQNHPFNIAREHHRNCPSTPLTILPPQLPTRRNCSYLIEEEVEQFILRQLQDPSHEAHEDFKRKTKQVGGGRGGADVCATGNERAMCGAR